MSTQGRRACHVCWLFTALGMTTVHEHGRGRPPKLPLEAEHDIWIEWRQGRSIYALAQARDLDWITVKRVIERCMKRHGFGPARPVLRLRVPRESSNTQHQHSEATA